MRSSLAFALVLALAADAHANGRPAATSTIHFRQGHETDIVAGMTFGLTISHDGGATWDWMCEAAVGYGGLYDPFYSYTQNGKLFATTFAGLKVMTDGCTFAATPPGMTFVSNDELASDQSLFITAADSSDSKIYKSTDEGVSFPTSASPGQAGDWWQSLVVASGSPNKVFISGYRYVNKCDPKSVKPFAPCTVQNELSDCMEGRMPAGGSIHVAADACLNMKELLVFSSIDGGASFQPMPGNQAIDAYSTKAAGLTTSANSTIDLVGVSSDGSTLYARVGYENANLPSDGIYKIDTASGTTWTRLLGVNDITSTVLRANGDIVVMSRTLGGQVSHDSGTTWVPLVNPPHVNCLAENPADQTLWACTQNYGSPGVPSDGYGIMKTTDLATWTGVLVYQQIQKPVSCSAGTPQHDMCEAQSWCSLKQQLGITSTAINCPALVDGPPSGDAGVMTKPPKTGCCETGNGGATTALGAGTVVATLLLRRRRRRLR
jgi:hypothetical protein